MNKSRTIANQSKPTGFTLLEVILALAILAGSVAILGQVMRLASRNAADAHAETRAQILAATKMDEILSGMVPQEEAVREPLDVEDTMPWLYSVTLTDTEFEGVTAIEVLVEQELEKQFHPTRYRLIRWMADTETEDSRGS